MRGPNDFLDLGNWNARCDRCGRKMKGSDLVETWQGFQVCPEHWEPRQPQDFVRSIQEDPTPPFVRNPAEIFIVICTPNGRTAVSDFAVANCAVADYIDPAFDPTVTEVFP